MNKPELPPFLVRLSLGMDADPRAIRRAYARELKLIDQEADAEAFQFLREQYEAALQWHAWQTWEDEQSETESETETAPEPLAQPVSLVKSETVQAAPHAEADDEANAGPQELAFAVFRRLVDTCECLTAMADDATVAQWEQEIRAHLAAEELVNVDARTIFEQLIVDWLAAGWVPGKEKLFAAAPEVFGWEQDRRRLQQFGYAGTFVGQAIDERSFFLGMNEEELVRHRNTIALLRASFEPDVDRIKYIMTSVEQLMASFPHLMALSVSSETVARWREVFVQRGGNIEQVRQAAIAEPKVEESGGSFPWGFAFLVLIMVLRGCSSMGGSSYPSASSDPSPRTYLPSSAPVVLDRNTVDAIGTDLRYTFPKDTPPGTYTVSYDLLVDLQGKVTYLTMEKSGYPDFDEAVWQAILRAQPFMSEAGKLVKFSHSVTVK